jgi:hypothetical protein
MKTLALTGPTAAEPVRQFIFIDDVVLAALKQAAISGKALPVPGTGVALAWMGEESLVRLGTEGPLLGDPL